MSAEALVIISGSETPRLQFASQRLAMKLKGDQLDFVKAKNAVFLSSLTYRQKIARLRRIESEFRSRYAKKPRLALEVRRRIAEALLDMSISRGLTMATCRARLKSLSKLGFGDIEQKAHYQLIYARTALERGHRQIALNIATRMLLELTRSLRRRRSLLGRELLGRFQELLTRTR